MTLQSQQQEQERYLAYHDMLTGLPNRGHFIKLLEQEMLHAAHAKEMFAVLFPDLDKFNNQRPERAADTWGATCDRKKGFRKHRHPVATARRAISIDCRPCRTSVGALATAHGWFAYGQQRSRSAA